MFLGDLRKKLTPTDGIAKAILVVAILVCIFLLVQPNPVLRAAGALWIALP